MKCNYKHDGMMVLHAFSDGPCEVCGKDITTPHIPCDKVCESCSEEHKLCTICGDDIKFHTKEYSHYLMTNTVQGFNLTEEGFYDMVKKNKQFRLEWYSPKPSGSLKGWVRVPGNNKSFVVPKEVANYIDALENPKRISFCKCPPLKKPDREFYPPPYCWSCQDWNTYEE